MSNTVIPIDDGGDITDMSSTTNFTPEEKIRKRRRTSSIEKNKHKIELKLKTQERKKRQD